MKGLEQEDVRRERELLKREQDSHRNKIEELLRQLGMPVGEPRRSDYLNWLAQQRDWEGKPVPPGFLAEISRLHARLQLVGKQLAALEE